MFTRVIVTAADARGVESRLILRADAGVTGTTADFTVVTADTTALTADQVWTAGSVTADSSVLTADGTFATLASPVSVGVPGEARVARTLEA